MEFFASLHPKIVHFPIALLIVYTLLEGIGLVFKKDIFTKAAFIILIFGVLGALAAVLTGNQAEETWKNWSSAGKNLLEEHETFASITLWYFFGVLILRTLFVINIEIKNKFVVHATKMKIAFVILALTGCFFVYETGEHGGEMVYKHGAGVSIEKQAQQNQVEHGD
ncbi:MAG: hypothetical protein COW85_06385 [Ignavibacteria bacterium CG22_combo_CG10-13_8_21_14_all_37_15]|nr:MAG: hypothetical protein COW85_06385 [Ignavibacteria bacterium CG22_combo_CG10-13_8_21_14_all_37_15]PIS45506.1 MAG: hypothetical protein COT22_04920 [Ignavibacteria bacterium CG08_land_8_20_14_0_20_37_9]